jgi:hypothetical protein
MRMTSFITGSSKELLERKSNRVEAFLAERVCVSRENDNAHLGGLRFLGQNVPQVRRQASHQAVGQERESVFGESPGNNQGEPLDEAGNPDSSAQPHDQGLGELPSTRRRKEDVFEGGQPHLAGDLALGAA